MSTDRDAAKALLHEALHSLSPRIPGLEAGDCHCNLLAEVAVDALNLGAAIADVPTGGPRFWAMPPEPGPDVIRVRDVYGQCFERGDAINDDGSTEPVWLGDAFTDEADVPDLYLSWQQLMKYHSPLTEVVSDVA